MWVVVADDAPGAAHLAWRVPGSTPPIARRWHHLVEFVPNQSLPQSVYCEPVALGPKFLGESPAAERLGGLTGQPLG